MNLLLLEAHEVDDAGSTHLCDVRAAHLIHVLKVQPGSTVRVGLVNGPMGRATVCARDAMSLTLTCRWDPSLPQVPRIDLLLAVPRPKVLKRLWAQLAALGVGEIVLTQAARVERCYFDTHVLDPSFYRPLLLEGLQQARDTRVPNVRIHRAFRPLVEDAADPVFANPIRLMAHPVATTRLTHAVPSRGSGRATLAIGPEGGWVPFEQELLSRQGFIPVSLGDRILRSDTACIALISLLQDRLRD